MTNETLIGIKKEELGVFDLKVTENRWYISLTRETEFVPSDFLGKAGLFRTIKPHQ